MNELAMIGDNIDTDIKGALNAGIEKVVWINNNNKFEKNKENEIYAINELKQLKEIF